MKNAILEICQRLRGYSDTEYFDVVKVIKLENGNYEVEVRVINEARCWEIKDAEVKE